MAVSSPGKTTFRLSGHTPLGKTAFPLRRDAHVTNRTSEPDRRLTRLAGHTPPGRNAPPHRPHAASQGTFGSRDRASCPTAAKSAATELATRNGHKPHEAVACAGRLARPETPSGRHRPGRRARNRAGTGPARQRLIRAGSCPAVLQFAHNAESPPPELKNGPRTMQRGPPGSTGRALTLNPAETRKPRFPTPLSRGHINGFPHRRRAAAGCGGRGGGARGCG